MKMFQKASKILFLLSLISIPTFAQHPFTSEKLNFTPDTTVHGSDLYFRLSNENFFKNNEYFGLFQEGYTLLGYKLRPTFIYLPIQNVSLEAGIEWMQYQGLNHISNLVPYVAATWNINRSWSVRMGSLDGMLHHNLPDQILNDERELINKPETGAQVRVKTDIFDGEIFINWHQFIKSGDTIPEKFMAGVLCEFYPLKKNSTFELIIPLQWTANHIGGQVSDYPMTVQSHTNGVLGLQFRRNYKELFVTNWEVGIKTLMFYTMNGQNVLPFKAGGALLPNASFVSKWFDVSLDYFHSRYFHAVEGNPIYSCISIATEDYYCKNRNLFSAQANLTYEICPCVRFSAGGRLFYDFDNEQLDYLYQFYLTITPLIKIVTIKG